jgi:Skp family chaperone for outer membrane proteins
MDELKQRLDKEYETQQTSCTAQMRALEQRQERDRESSRRNATADEAKTQRSLQSSQETEMKQFLARQKKEYAHMKDSMRRVTEYCLIVAVAAGIAPDDSRQNFGAK